MIPLMGMFNSSVDPGMIFINSTFDPVMGLLKGSDFEMKDEMDLGNDSTLDNNNLTRFTLLGPNNSTKYMTLEEIEGYEIHRRTYMILIPFLMLLLLVAVAGNILILGSCPFLTRPVTPYLKLCVSLSAADLVATILIIKGLIINSFLPGVLNIPITLKCLTITLEVFRISGMFTSVLHLLALSINQFIGILYPIHYRWMVTNKRTTWTLIVLWVLPLILISSSFMISSFLSESKEECTYVFYSDVRFRSMIFVLFSVPLIITFIIYSVILRFLLKARSNFTNSDGTEEPMISKNRVDNKLKVVTTTLLILSTFTFSWGICVVYFLMVCRQGCVFIYLETISHHTAFIMNTVINTLVAAKLAINPLIYALRISHFRHSIDRSLTALCEWDATGWMSIYKDTLPTDTYVSYTRAINRKTTAIRGVREQLLIEKDGEDDDSAVIEISRNKRNGHTRITAKATEKEPLVIINEPNAKGCDLENEKEKKITYIDENVEEEHKGEEIMEPDQKPEQINEVKGERKNDSKIVSDVANGQELKYDNDESDSAIEQEFESKANSEQDDSKISSEYEFKKHSEEDESKNSSISKEDSDLEKYKINFVTERIISIEKTTCSVESEKDSELKTELILCGGELLE
uniref:G_PROTEIN_RECEP_F1_2 domain-containing protein n=1 Tax=Rhabditophanes sp. KR3021 TaxID=114890 RepID=A0AC35U785_9BILA